MSSLQGLPPLPRSLSGFNLSGGRCESGEPPPPPTRSSSKSQRGGKTSLQSSSSRPSPPARQLTTLDTQLAVLRREMVLVQGSFSLSCFSADVEECGLVTLIGRTHPSLLLGIPRNIVTDNRLPRYRDVDFFLRFLTPDDVNCLYMMRWEICEDIESLSSNLIRQECCRL